MPGPLANQEFGVVDLHMHPSLKVYLFNRKFWNPHNPPGFLFPPTMRTDLDALIAGGVQAFLSTIYVPEKGIEDDIWPMRYLKHLHAPSRRFLEEEPDDLARETLNQFKAHIAETRRRRGDIIQFAQSYDHMERIMAEGKIAIVQSLEGAHHLNGKLENLDDFFQRGVAHLILAHFYTNEACGSVDPIPTDLILRKIGCFTYKRDLFSRLSPWGCELVDRMWDLGILADMTHATPRCRQDILHRAQAHPKKRPVIMSHVGLHHFMPHPMNPTDDEIRHIADTGGLIGLIFMRFWLSHPEQPEAADILLKSVQHLVNTGGEDCVAFGSDYDGFTPVPRDFKSPRDYNRLRSLLLRKFTENQVQKFLKTNALRVLKSGWG